MRKFILQLKQLFRGQPAPEAIHDERHDVSLGRDGSDRIDACPGDYQSLAREGDHQSYGDKAWDELSGDRKRHKPHFLGRTMTISADSANTSSMEAARII